jgi:hypothetical protein
MSQRETLTTTTVFGTTLLAWAVAIREMQGMNAGPGTSLGSFAWFLGIWATMTVAMMLPGATPGAVLFSRFHGGLETFAFLVGQLVVWTACGAAAYSIDHAVRQQAPSFVAWDNRGPWLAGAALAGAGVYQLTPLKAACLRLPACSSRSRCSRCRSSKECHDELDHSRQLLRVVQLRCDLPVPTNRRRNGWPLHTRPLSRRPLLADRRRRSRRRQPVRASGRDRDALQRR